MAVIPSLAIGRLSSITETNPTLQVTGIIAYDYDASGRLNGLTYPSGRSLSCGFDSLGRVNQVSTTNQRQCFGQRTYRGPQHHG